MVSRSSGPPGRRPPSNGRHGGSPARSERHPAYAGHRRPACSRIARPPIARPGPPHVIDDSATTSTQSGVPHVKYRLTAVAFTLLLGLALPALAADTPQPVRMGCGHMTFDTV